jgi:DNA-binding helix-hairpin-helix protein with protein kinase domain
MTGDSGGDVELADLTAAEKIADGGHGSVFRLSRPAGVLLKLYHGGIAVLAGELARLIELRTRSPDLAGAPTAWPTGRVFERGRCVGLLMPAAPDRFTTRLAGRSRLRELQFLLYPRRAMWADLALPTDEERRVLAVGYVRLFEVLHRNDVVVGDVSMRNLLWTLEGGPGVYAIDCDGFRLAGRPPSVRPSDTAGWVDPACPRAVTLDADRYKLALLTVRLLLGNHTVTPADVCAKPLLRAAFGGALGSLVARAARPGKRPAAESWLAALTSDVAAGGSRIAFPCFPLPVSGGVGKTLSTPLSRPHDGNQVSEAWRL